MFESKIFGGELPFPADHDSLVVGTSWAHEDDLEYLHNSAISLSQLFQSENLGPQRQKDVEQERTEPTSSPEEEVEEDWLRNLLSSEDSFDPDFLENLDLESLDQKNVQDEAEKNIVEDVSLSASLSLSQVSEDPEDSSLAELLSDGPGVGISREIILGSQWVEDEKDIGDGDWLGNILQSEDSFDPGFLDNIEVDSLDPRTVLEEEEVEQDEVLGYTVELETIEGPEPQLPEVATTFPPTPPQSPEERSKKSATLHLQTVPPGVIVGNQSQPHSVLKSVSQPAVGVEVKVKNTARSKVVASGQTGVKKKKKKCRLVPEERAAHNKLERERRQEMNNAYGCLRDSIPAIAANKKSSKQMILDAALDYCRGLAGKLERLERIQEEEVERQRGLEEQLARLQSEN